MSEARDRPEGAGEGVFPGSAEATSEDRLRRAISIETVGVLFFRLDGRILDANAAFERMSGYTVRELRTTTLWETLTPPEFMEVAARAAAELAERGETAPYEKQLLRRDGSRWWGLVAPTRLAGHGRGSECVEFVLDITAAKENEAALRASEERHRQIIEGARDYAIFTTDAEGRIESWSPGAEAVFGWTVGEALGKPVDITFTPEDRAAGEPEKERAHAREHGSAPDVRWHLRKDGARVFIDGVTRAVAGPGGEVRGFLKIGQDVTQRRATEDALRESRERFRTLVQNIRDYAIFLTDARGVVTEWTEGAERVKGYTAEEAVGRHLSLFYTPEEVAAGEVERELDAVVREGRAEREAWRVRKGGARIWVNEITTAIRDGEGALVGFTFIARDLTDRMRAEERLRELNESLECRVRERTAELAESNRALAAEIAERERAEASRSDVLRQLVTVEEEERRRISRELHDSLGQFVTGLMLGLKALEHHPGQLSRIQDLERLADRIAREMQDLAVELRPPALDNLGLAPALRNHLEEWSRRHGVACDFHALGIEGGRLRPEVETTVYRVVQEGLNNVLKHAGASRVSLVLERRGGVLSAILEDDGGGFDVEATLATPEKAKRLGVRGMRERVALLGGELEIESSPGAGTSVFVRIPAPPADG
ncbi:MAG: PAS domain S-box protein [Longimicrobiaceae bacterium]